MSAKRFLFKTDQLNLNKAETEDYWEIEGLASTNNKDLQDEIIEQNFDLTSIQAGKVYLNDDHGHNYPVKDHARLGVIDSAKITKKGLWIKGKVWKNHPASVSYYNELKHKPGMVQFSVEGFTLERDPRDEKKVKKAHLTGVALTRNPVNPYTFANLVKSLTEEGLIHEETNKEKVIKSYSIDIERDKDNQEEIKTVTVTKVLDASHPEFAEMYALEEEFITKGGPGSGKKYAGGPKVKPASQREHAIRPNEHAKKVEVVTPEDQQKEQKNPKLKDNQRREEYKRELEYAKEGAHSKEEAKQNVAEVKERRAARSKRKKLINVRIKKSALKAELLRRAALNPEFKKSLETILAKSATSGGPAYATQPAVNMTDGQIFQQESLNNHKNQCKKCKDSKMCKCNK